MASAQYADRMKKYGISLPEDVADEIEAPLEEGDSRSQRIRELIKLGLAAERAMTAEQWYPPSASEREEMVEEAVREHIS